jgi:hypothetical protein
MYPKRSLRTVAFSMLLALASATAAMAAEGGGDRIGFSEDFDSLAGWKVMEADRPLKEMKAVDGRAVISTWVGSIGATKPAGQPKSLGATSSIVKQYDQEVDLDRYHYLVMKTDEKSGYSLLYLNKKETQVNYTSGIIVQDLRDLGLSGKQKPFFELEIMNTGHVMKVDYIRLVSQLTDEEKAGLIPPGIHIYKENIRGQLYQNLDALNARSARPSAKGDSPKAVFRDVGTGALTWRMTSDPSDKGFSEHYAMWRPDGSGFCLHPGGRPYYSYDLHKFASPPANFYNLPLQLVGYQGKNRDETAVLQWNETGKKWEEIARFKAAGVGVGGNKAVLRNADGSIIVLNAAATDPAKRIRTFPFPIKDAKGNSLSADGKYLGFNAPWGSYQHFEVDTDTGEFTNGYLWTFTHGMHGDPYSIMSYGTGAKLVVPTEQYRGNGTPGKALALYGPYLDPVITDYGIMTSDGRYGVCNGIGGELDGQHLIFDRTDPGTIMRVATYHVSKVNWNIWTKSIPSPDYTKLAYVSDMLGYSDFYIAVIRQPDAPQKVAAEKTGDAVRLTWQPPTRSREIQGYNIYRSEKSGQGFVRINKELVTSNEFTDAASPAKAFYLVAGQEHSGLEGLFSREVAVNAADAPLTLHYVALEQEHTKPMREVFDGNEAGCRAMRITPVAEGEQTGTLTIDTGFPRAADVTVWARVRAYRKPGAFQIAVEGQQYAKTPAPLTVATNEWTWVQSHDRLQKPNARLVLSSSDDGVAVSQVIVTEDKTYKPDGLAERTAPLPAVTGLKLAKASSDTLNLAWDAPTAPDVYYYSVYVSDKPDFECNNQTILCSGMTSTATDWGLRAGAKFYYKVVAVNRRGQPSAPALFEAQTVARDVYTQEIPAAQATLGAGAAVSKDQDISYAGFKDGSAPTVSFDFTVPADGDYFLWMDYGMRFAKDRVVKLQLDGKDFATWEGRQPTRMDRDPEANEPKVRWFVDRMWLKQGWNYRDHLALKAGKHMLTATLGEKSPWLSKLIVTDDPSLVPPGYSAQVRFNRLRRQ